jgi:hypothetical protein
MEACQEDGGRLIRWRQARRMEAGREDGFRPEKIKAVRSENGGKPEDGGRPGEWRQARRMEAGREYEVGREDGAVRQENEGRQGGWRQARRMEADKED